MKRLALLAALVALGCSHGSASDAGPAVLLTGPSSTSATGTPPLARIASSDWLNATNAVRATVGVFPLSWSTTNEGQAASWAAGCVFAHNPNRSQNLAALTPSTETNGLFIVGLWADEKAFYHPANNSCDNGKVCGHYTQLVWSTTRTVGCAAQRCTKNSPFSSAATWDLFVCDYDPGGNVEGQRPY